MQIAILILLLPSICSCLVKCFNGFEIEIKMNSCNQWQKSTLLKVPEIICMELTLLKYGGHKLENTLPVHVLLSDSSHFKRSTASIYVHGGGTH